MSVKKTIAVVVVTAVLSAAATVGIEAAVLGLTDGATIGNAMRFAGALRLIETRYVNDTDNGKLMDGAINGMMKSLDDPHSVYMDPGLYHRLTEQTEGAFGGIGVYMGFKGGKVSILSVMDNTPGARAGLKANDEIIAVDGTPVSEIKSEEVAMRIRGKVGTEVSLTVRRDGEDDRIFTITRDTIKVATAVGTMLDGENDLGYIRIASFSENTAVEFRQAFDELKQKGMNGLIIDLRQNPGGLLASVVDIADLVVPKGLIVSVVERNGKREEYTSKLEQIPCPMVVLIDGNSASASEILAGALKDTQAATIVGETSYGKGSVQAVIPLFHDDAIKLTIAKYYTPSGISIDGTGIKPDVPVALDTTANEDTQLTKAKEVLRDKMS